jgi:hypothetical protein
MCEQLGQKSGIIHRQICEPVNINMREFTITRWIFSAGLKILISTYVLSVYVLMVFKVSLIGRHCLQEKCASFNLTQAVSVLIFQNPRRLPVSFFSVKTAPLNTIFYLHTECMYCNILVQNTQLPWKNFQN